MRLGLRRVYEHYPITFLLKPVLRLLRNTCRFVIFSIVEHRLSLLIATISASAECHMQFTGNVYTANSDLEFVRGFWVYLFPLAWQTELIISACVKCRRL